MIFGFKLDLEVLILLLSLYYFVNIKDDLFFFDIFDLKRLLLNL